MEEERPSLETEYTQTEEPTPDVDNNSGKSSKLIFAVIGVVAIALVVVGLLLPPISLADRLGLSGNEATATTVVDEATAAPAEETITNNPVIPGEFEVMAEGAAVNVTAVSPANMAEANIGALPTHVVALGNLYALTATEGSAGEVAVTLPTGADARTTDLYGWDGAAWHFVASEVDTAANHIASQPGNLYAAYALVQPGTPAAYIFSADVGPQAEVAPEILERLDAVNAGILLLEGNGDVEGTVAAVPEGDYERYLHVTNSGVVVDTASLATFLGDSAAQSNQINTLVNTAVSNNYNGLNLDYQGVELAQKEAFTSFASNLADALHAQGLKLIITLGTPQEASGGWNTGGQDWAALGAIADELYVQMPLDPLAYGEGGPARQLLDYAVRHIDRTRLLTLNSANAVSRVGQSIVEISNETALANFGAFDQAEEALDVEPGTAVELALTGEATPLEWDGVSQTYHFSYEGDADQTYQVWLGNPAALGHRLELGEGYNLRGTAVRGLDSINNPTAYLAALAALGPDAPPQTEGAAVVWTVSDENESVLASESGNALTFAWPGHETPGIYTVTAEFALGEAIIPLDALTVNVGEPVAEEEAEVEVEGTATPAAGGTATYDPGDADGVAKILANVRTGPGLQFGTLTGGAPAGTKVNITGRNEAADWFQVVLPDNRQGWMYIQVLELNESLDVNALAVVEVPEPVAGDPGSGGSGPPPPVSAPPVASGSFELGGQTHSFANPIVMSSAGMNWVKFQHKWGPGDSPSAVAGRIAAAHAAGFKVLLSIPGANTYPDSIDFNSYVEFLRGVAALGPDAIEVWNEVNIDFEWPEGQIDPASYINNMLAPAYNAIKSANGNVMVISGAPAPTGFDNGTNAWSDSRYMAGFFAAGGGNYADCIGAHYNAGASTPTQNSGHPTGSAHYSWYLVPTLNVYAQGGKPVCFTELGYLSGEDFGGVPERFSWAANTTIGQHAAWLAEAVSVAANTGKVRMVIVFNVDFTHWSDDPQAGYAIIRKDGSCPACSTLAGVMGR